MPASIRVDSGISVGARHWIDRPVLRIGSDPQCDICLPSPGLASHTLTLEFRDGAYRIYNRDSTTITVGDTTVKPGAAASWHHHATVVLPGDLRLVLEVDGDPRPALPPDSSSQDVATDDMSGTGVDAMTATGAGKASKKSSTTQLAIISVCMVAIAGLLMTQGGDRKVSPDRPTFEAIVQTSLDSNDATRDVVRRLQYAQAALVRGHRRLARERFLKLRDELVNANRPGSAESKASMDDILSYVEYQLSQLE